MSIPDLHRINPIFQGNVILFDFCYCICYLLSIVIVCYGYRPLSIPKYYISAYTPGKPNMSGNVEKKTMDGETCKCGKDCSAATGGVS